MKNLIFIIVSLLCLTACQWDLDKFDLDGNIYDCEKTCENGICDGQNVCVCNEGWGGKDCDTLVTNEETSIVTFQKTINIQNSTFIRGHSVISTDDNGYMVLGYAGREANLGNEYIYLYKLDEFGEQKWEFIIEQYNSIFEEMGLLEINEEYYIGSRGKLTKIDKLGNLIFQKDIPIDFNPYLAKIDNESIMITGEFTGNHKNFWVSKYNISGEEIWSNNYGSFDSNSDVMPRKILSLDGVALLLAYTTPSNLGGIHPKYYGKEDILITKIDSLGNKIWLKNFGGSENDKGSNLISIGLEQTLVLGHTTSTNFDLANNTETGGWVFCIDNNGNILWQKIYNIDYFMGVFSKGNGNYTLAGIINGTPDILKIIEITKSGEIVSEKSKIFENVLYFGDIKSTIDGGYILIGTYENNEGIFLAKTDADGNI